jgi:predicted metalloprotease
MAIGGGLGGIVILLIALLLGADPRQLLEQLPSDGQAPATQSSRPTNPEEEELRQFVGAVLADTEDVWNDIFRQLGRQYREPTLVVFTDQVQSACGVAGATVGPFYCPGDEKLYIDLSFYRELKTRFRAPGDFAQAYVIAHEIGHHVQHLLGTMDQVDSARRRLSEAEANQLSVRLELQADFLAGAWAHHAQKRGNWAGSTANLRSLCLPIRFSQLAELPVQRLVRSTVRVTKSSTLTSRFIVS